MNDRGGKILGIAINDSDSPVSSIVDGRCVYCPIYSMWKQMIYRCYNKTYLARQPTYIGCEVHADWLFLSKFKEWAESKDWEGGHLDKDILFPGNKIYSPETCAFVSKGLNNFLTLRGRGRGKYMIGVSFDGSRKKFLAQCCDPFKNGSSHVGYFDSEIEAHNAWRAKKREIALIYAEIQKDDRVSEALRAMFLPKELMQ